MDECWADVADAVIVAKCLDGDDKAWRALVQRYKRLVYSIPIKWGLSPEDAVDIFQAVWLDCFRQLTSLRDVERLQPWLIRIAVRKCHRFSTQKRERAEDVLPDEVFEDISIEDPTSFAADLDREQALRMAMEKLTPRCRQIIQYLFFEDPRPSYEAIASRLGLSANSIGFTRERCLNSLKKLLNDSGHEDEE